MRVKVRVNIRTTGQIHARIRQQQVGEKVEDGLVEEKGIFESSRNSGSF